MSLLDDVSIVVTPNGYKAGELYAVVPVPTEGAEEVTNGDFATNSDWATAPSGVTISGGSANFNLASDTYVYQDIMTATKTYKITFSGTINSGSLYIGENGIATNIYTAGTYTNEVAYFTVASSVRFIIRRTGTGTLDATIDNVSVKEYTSADMDVTRATAATRVDENGLVNYAEVLGGELAIRTVNANQAFFFNPYPNNTTTYDGGNTIITYVDNTGGAYAYFNSSYAIPSDFVIGVTYKISITFKINSGNVQFRLFNGVSSLFTEVTNSTSFITKTVYMTAQSVSGAFIKIDTMGSGQVLTISDMSVKEVTRDNVPRIDYTGGGCPHILAEPMRTNTVTYSEDFSQYSSSGTTPTLTTGQLAPDGTLGATKISGTIGSSVLWLPSVTSATDARSIYARTVSGTGTAKLMSYFGNTNNTFNLTEEWQRFELTSVTTTSGESNFYIDLRGSQTLSEFIVWGGQCEVGSYPTSLIPTSGSTVTRNQDIFTRDGIGSLINSTEGVLFVEMARQEGDTSAGLITLNDGTNSQTVSLYYFSTGTIYFDILSGSPNVSQGVSGIDTYSFNKIALKYKSGDIALWVNGVEVATSASAISLTGLNTLSFSQGNDAYPFNGKVKQLQVYDTALTDEQLLQLTGESGTDFYESYAEMASALTYTIQ